MPPEHHPLRIAHRGMPRRARENTLASFALALAAGADGIELDVHATADEVVIVHHDPTLPDGTPIASLTLAELHDREASPADHIPTLRDVCDLVKARAELFVEIKGAGIEREVVAVLGACKGRFAIHSFDHALIQRTAELQTGYRLGILVDDAGCDIARTMKATGALDVWPEHSLVTQALIDGVHAFGGRVLVWTVNDTGVAQRLSAMGADGICSDDVTMLD